MKRATIQRGCLSAGMALWGVLSGCAVLIVDVDVYKGALVNEEHVQLHQLVALATAAKPMLVQLRDSIEWPSEEMPVKTPEDQKGWYEPGYVKPPKPLVPPKQGWWCKRFECFCSDTVAGYRFFQNNLAVRVNAVLGLYEELDSSGEKINPDRIESGKEEGLTRLTEIYRELSRKSDHDTPANHPDELKKKLALGEHRLIDALVEVASKVLFFANHEGLASPPGTPGLILGGAEKFTRGLFGDFLTDRSMYALLNSELAEAKKQQYVRVLQAVGNSILFSANELRERERYRDLSKDKVRAEVTAANSVYSPNPRKVLDDLLQELQHEKDNAEKQLSEATHREVFLKAKLGDENAATGLHVSLNDASEELKAAEKSLADYLSAHLQLVAIHNVMTDEVKDKIKVQWKAEGRADVSSLDDFLVGPDGLKGKLETVRNAQDGILTAEENLRFKDAAKYVESTGTKKAFEAHRTESGHTSMKLSDLLDEFILHIRRLESDRAKRVAQYEKARDEKGQRYQEVKSNIAKLTEELEGVKTLISQLPGSIDRFETARKVIAEVKADVVNDAEKAVQFVSPNAVYALVALHLDKKKEGADSEHKKPYQDAQEVLSRRTPPPGIPQLNPGGYQSPLAVMDEVIALLRHRQMEAVERSGKASEQDKKATEALENAYQHRAGMIYIRPSSAYLRTSFPSTSLQDDPNLAWDNMLLNQGIRNLPFSSQLRDILDPSVRQDRLLTSELDKQYWQNINRVRVSGVGFTNQVLAKDDVGNWYVKQYYGDTEDIVKSAKHLALYSLGTKLPIDLSHELGMASHTKEKSEGKEESPPLQRVLEKHKSAYQAQTAEVSARLEALHGKNGKTTVHDQIVTAWENVGELKNDANSMDALKAALDAEIREWDKAAEALKSIPDQDQGQVIVKDIRAFSRFDKLLSARLQTLSTLKTKAIAEVNRVVGPLVLDMLKDRKRALDGYEQAIMFIADAANLKNSP